MYNKGGINIEDTEVLNINSFSKNVTPKLIFLPQPITLHDSACLHRIPVFTFGYELTAV